MGKFNCQEFNEKSQANELWYSISQVIFGVIMVGIGASYQPLDESDASFVNATPEKRDPCPNGAAYWLLVGGIVHLVVNIINIPAKIYKRMSEKENTCANAVGGLASIPVLADVGILIWGCVIVYGGFGAWFESKDDYGPDYCDSVPFISAFVILILQQIIRNLILALTCLSVSKSSSIEEA